MRNFNVGDRVVIPSTIACGICSYCRAGYYAQCDDANPNGPQAGTAFFGGPEATGPLRRPAGRVRARPVRRTSAWCKLPDEVTDEQAILLSDIFPTGYFGAELAEIKPGDTVAVFGCGPVGQFAIVEREAAGRRPRLRRRLRRRPAGRWRATQGAEIDRLRRGGPGRGASASSPAASASDRAIDAVGVDAEHAAPRARREGAAKTRGASSSAEVEGGRARSTNPDGDNWRPGDAPVAGAALGGAGAGQGGHARRSSASTRRRRARFPIGEAMNKNLTLKMGNCNHRKYIPQLLELVRTGAVDPTQVLTQRRADDAAPSTPTRRSTSAARLAEGGARAGGLTRRRRAARSFMGGLHAPRWRSAQASASECWSVSPSGASSSAGIAGGPIRRLGPSAFGAWPIVVVRLARRIRVLLDHRTPSAFRIGIVGGVAAADGVPLAVPALRTRRQMLRGADVQLVVAVRARIGAGGHVTAGRDRIGHKAPRVGGALDLPTDLARASRQ